MKEQTSSAKQNFNRLIDKKVTSIHEDDIKEGKAPAPTTSKYAFSLCNM